MFERESFLIMSSIWLPLYSSAIKIEALLCVSVTMGSAKDL